MNEPTVKSLNLPLDEAAVRSLRCGDFIQLSGVLFTARDAAHKRMADGRLPLGDVRGGVFYHCGPVTVLTDRGWRVTAAGPTTSIREEPYMPGLIERLQLRAVIGKGGMGLATLAACRQFGCVYLHAVGGAAQVLARTVKRVIDVYWLDELGPPEAIWELEVHNFPAVVTMDAHGHSLHDEVAAASRTVLDARLASTDAGK